MDRQKALRKKGTIHQVITMLATSENVIFPGHNHLLTTSTDDPSLAGAQAILNMSGHQHWWLTGGYDLEIGHFLDCSESVSMAWNAQFMI